MSWKTDKFQALRDRAQNTKVGQAPIEAAEINARTRSTELHIRGVLAEIRAEADKAKAVAEITRELRGDPEPDPYARPVRFTYAFDYGIKRDQPLVGVIAA